MYVNYSTDVRLLLRHPDKAIVRYILSIRRFRDFGQDIGRVH